MKLCMHAYMFCDVLLLSYGAYCCGKKLVSESLAVCCKTIGEKPFWDANTNPTKTSETLRCQTKEIPMWRRRTTQKKACCPKNLKIEIPNWRCKARLTLRSFWKVCLLLITPKCLQMRSKSSKRTIRLRHLQQSWTKYKTQNKKKFQTKWYQRLL